MTEKMNEDLRKTYVSLDLIGIIFPCEKNKKTFKISKSLFLLTHRGRVFNWNGFVIFLEAGELLRHV